MIICDFSSAHKKFSGQVFIVWISHGTANPFTRSPDFHSQRAEQFSAHKASLMADWSWRAPCSSFLETRTLSISWWISSRALFTSSVFDFVSSRAQTSLILLFFPINFYISTNLASVSCSWWLKTYEFNFSSICSFSSLTFLKRWSKSVYSVNFS